MAVDGSLEAREARRVRRGEWVERSGRSSPRLVSVDRLVSARKPGCASSVLEYAASTIYQFSITMKLCNTSCVLCQLK